MPRVTQLYTYHVRHARMMEFAGFLMPLFYSGIIEEHLSVRESCGIFDVSHMGRILIKGKDATKFVQRVLPTNAEKYPPGRAFYSLLLNEDGGIKDDLIAYRLAENEYLFVVNAVNRQKDFNWLKLQSTDLEVDLRDISDSTAMMALQGPKSSDILESLLGDKIELKRFHHTKASWCCVQMILARTGYTGEDGFELIVLDTPIEKPDNALKLWNRLIEAGAKACGLGARDTLRIEAGLCLYGNDIDESINPIEAGLERVVDLQKPYFIGKDKLLEIKDSPSKRRVGLLMISRGVPRQGCEIIYGGETVGWVTSGTFSPLLKRGIAMGYVTPEAANPGTPVTIRLRERVGEAEIHGFPFYDETKYGWKRKSA
jgi:aminomethyltransferase